MAVELLTLPGELFEEILLRLPPDEPACLLRASLVCKAWGCAVTCPSLRRRLHELHRTTPVLGFLHDRRDESISDFIPTTISSFSLTVPDRRCWRALNCRHGRVLFLSNSKGQNTEEFLLWEPITGAQQRIPAPVAYDNISANVIVYPPAAVFCTADGCDHHDCLGGPFCVLFIFSVNNVDTDDDTDDDGFTWAGIYSSETGTWGELTSLHPFWPMCFTFYSSVLVGRSLLYFMFDDGSILEYDLARHGLAVVDPPESDYIDQCNIMLAEDGGLGVNEVMNLHLKLWAREASDITDARWVLSRVIYLGSLLPISAFVDAETRVLVLGFAEGANVIFVTTVAGVFMIKLQSNEVRKVCDDHGFRNLIPVVSFYTPMPRVEHKDLSLKHSEEADGTDQEGEEEKTADHAQQLINNGSNVNKEGDFVNILECAIHATENRVPPCGEVAPKCTGTVNKYGCSLLCEAQEASDPLGDVPKSARNEESAKSSDRIHKDGAGNSENLQ
ncbi:uncharacterized protein LOC125552898 isoform X1 [Triticum urartu]|uniref:uncharacterized protein LOC125552898 isoform X1 n=1 Tax=Triticum urartu TaxID=4572 RepID=UPI002043B0ED|nr:uncharacterized protein LOC125552898 isoform X1 [Triticum urartu]